VSDANRKQTIELALDASQHESEANRVATADRAREAATREDVANTHKSGLDHHKAWVAEHVDVWSGAEKRRTQEAQRETDARKQLEKELANVTGDGLDQLFRKAAVLDAARSESAKKRKAEEDKAAESCGGLKDKVIELATSFVGLFAAERVFETIKEHAKETAEYVKKEVEQFTELRELVAKLAAMRSKEASNAYTTQQAEEAYAA